MNFYKDFYPIILGFLKKDLSCFFERHVFKASVVKRCGGTRRIGGYLIGLF